MRYEQFCVILDKKMMEASKLVTKQEQQNFVTETFVNIVRLQENDFVSHEDYLKLINKLATYKAGIFNDYLDLLAGSVPFGLLGWYVERSKHEDLASQTQQRSKAITEDTGIEPHKPEE